MHSEQFRFLFAGLLLRFQCLQSTIAAIACQPPAQQSKGGQQAKQHIFLHELTVVLLCIAYRISATDVKSTLYARKTACWKDYIVFDVTGAWIGED